jgi:hypothetical protein
VVRGTEFLRVWFDGSLYLGKEFRAFCNEFCGFCNEFCGISGGSCVASVVRA